MGRALHLPGAAASSSPLTAGSGPQARPRRGTTEKNGGPHPGQDPGPATARPLPLTAPPPSCPFQIRPPRDVTREKVGRSSPPFRPAPLPPYNKMAARRVSEGGGGARRGASPLRGWCRTAGGEVTPSCLGVGGGTRVLHGLAAWKKIKTKHQNPPCFIRDRKKKKIKVIGQKNEKSNAIKRLQGSHSSIYSIKAFLINSFSLCENLGRVQRCIKIRRFSSRACKTYLCF